MHPWVFNLTHVRLRCCGSNCHEMAIQPASNSKGNFPETSRKKHPPFFQKLLGHGLLQEILLLLVVPMLLLPRRGPTGYATDGRS